MTVVVDASVVVAGLASADATGRWAESLLAGGPLAAPHLMPVEAASILHRAELAGEISADAASLAHADLGRLRVEYFPYDAFARRIWELRSPGLAAPPGPASSGADNPAETLDYSFKQQVEMLQMESDRRENQARTALAEGREDLALAALQQRAALQGRLNDLRAKITGSGLGQKEVGERVGRAGLTSYEAWYVALAEFLGAKLATLDATLVLVPGPRCGFCLPPPPAA